MKNQAFIEGYEVARANHANWRNKEQEANGADQFCCCVVLASWTAISYMQGDCLTVLLVGLAGCKLIDKHSIAAQRCSRAVNTP